jgi:hypothetical protein
MARCLLTDQSRSINSNEEDVRGNYAEDGEVQSVSEISLQETKSGRTNKVHEYHII